MNGTRIAFDVCYIVLNTAFVLLVCLHKLTTDLAYYKATNTKAAHGLILNCSIFVVQLMLASGIHSYLSGYFATNKVDSFQSLIYLASMPALYIVFAAAALIETQAKRRMIEMKANADTAVYILKQMHPEIQDVKFGSEKMTIGTELTPVTSPPELHLVK